MIMSESDLRFFSLQQAMHMVSLVFIMKNYFGIICLFQNNILIQNDWIGNGVAEDLRHSSTWRPKIMIGQRCSTAQHSVLWSCPPAGLCWVSPWVWPGGTPGHRKTERVWAETIPQCSVSTAILLHKTRSWPSVIPQCLYASFSSQDKFQLRKIQLIFICIRWSLIKYNKLHPSLLEVNMFSATQSNNSCYIFVVRSLLCIAPNQDAQHPVQG